MTTRLMIATSLFGLSFSALITARQDEPTQDSALDVPDLAGVPTVTGVDLQLPPNAFGGQIEGAAVNAKGDVFAADFRASGAEANMAFAFFNQVEGAGANILDFNANPFFTVSKDGVNNPPLLAGARFLRGNQLLLADANNKRVIAVDVADDITVSTFCEDANMLQPNDIAVSVMSPTLIFLSGMNFSSDTTAGVSGDLWTCDGQNARKFPSNLLEEADVHRTNGIETSPDGSRLYLSSATNAEGNVTANRIYRFDIDTETGQLIETAPTIFFDFLGPDAAIDIDGMRTDVDGNLYVTRNGKGQIVKFSPEGQMLEVIDLPGMGGPSNLEFGGAEGKTLFAIGKCAADATLGCAASFETGSVGKAFNCLRQQQKITSPT